MDIKYLEAIKSLSKNLYRILITFPEDLQKQVREISLRADKPIVVSTFLKDYIVDASYNFTSDLHRKLFVLPPQEIFDSMRILTEYSLHSYKNEINQGYITIKGGHRAGVCGSCVYSNGKISSIYDISSINLRIARQVKGVANELVKRIYPEKVLSTLIVGPPASGKTTLLKDMARCLCENNLSFSSKLSIIDERGEIAAVYKGIPQNDVGIFTDVFDGYKKSDGMIQAIRAMSPKVLIIDEIAGEEDTKSILQCFNAGVKVIATIHASSLNELYKKSFLDPLLKVGAFEKIVVLKGEDTPCLIENIVSPKETLLC